jgi:hypothetical protein
MFANTIHRTCRKYRETTTMLGEIDGRIQNGSGVVFINDEVRVFDLKANKCLIIVSV